MVLASCKVNIPPVEGLEDGQMTVGRHMQLDCSTNEAALVDFAKASLRSNSSTPQMYRLFKVESENAQKFKLHLTLYKTGDVDISEFVLTDGVNDVAFQPQPVKVISVVEKPAEGKKPEPFGPVFPIEINLPLAYVIVMGAMVFTLILMLLMAIRKRAKLKSLKDGLVAYDSPTDPDTQFYRSLRVAEKADYPLEDIQKAFLLYNVRAYRIPLFQLNTKQAIKYFKQMYPQYKNTRLELDRFLTELSDMSAHAKDLSREARQELVSKMYRYVEKNRGVNQ